MVAKVEPWFAIDINTVESAYLLRLVCLNWNTVKDYIYAWSANAGLVESWMT